MDLLNALKNITAATQARALASIAGGASSMAQIREASEHVPDEEVLRGAVRNLTEYGAVERLVHAGPPFQVSYKLTDRGRELYQIIEAAKMYSQTHMQVGASGSR